MEKRIESMGFQEELAVIHSGSCPWSTALDSQSYVAPAFHLAVEARRNFFIVVARAAGGGGGERLVGVFAGHRVYFVIIFVQQGYRRMLSHGRDSQTENCQARKECSQNHIKGS